MAFGTVLVSAAHSESAVRCSDTVGLSFTNDMQFCMRTDIFISAVGRITINTPDNLESFLLTIGSRGYQPHSLTFHSPGGSLFGGIKLGRIIRELKLDTHVGEGSTCSSACMLSFIGGWSRKVTHDGRVGNHQLSNAATDVASIESVQSLIGYLSNYHREMNVSPLAVTAAMTRHSDEMYWYSSVEREEWGIVTKR